MRTAAFPRAFLYGNRRLTRLEIGIYATGAAILILSGHSSTVASVAFSPDGRMGLSGDYDGKLKLWDLTMPAQQ